jgi:hypothetical protein
MNQRSVLKKFLPVGLMTTAAILITFSAKSMLANTPTPHVTVPLYTNVTIEGKKLNCQLVHSGPSKDCDLIAAYKCCKEQSAGKLGGTSTLITSHPAHYTYDCDGKSCEDAGCGSEEAELSQSTALEETSLAK